MADNGNRYLPYHSAFLTSLCIVDIVLNSSVEFIDPAGNAEAINNNTTILIM